MDFCVYLITVPDAACGAKIAQTLVEERLAACVNQIRGLTSTYRWQGAIETAAEELLIVKSRPTLAEQLINRVKSLHPYTVPEIIALPIAAGSADYIQWLHAETREA